MNAPFTPERAAASVALTPVASSKASVAIRSGGSSAVKTVPDAGRGAVEISPLRTVDARPVLTPLVVPSASPRTTSPAVRRAPQQALRTVLRAVARLIAAAVVLVGIPLAASNPWTAIPLAAVLWFVLWRLTPSEARRAHRSPTQG